MHGHRQTGTQQAATGTACSQNVNTSPHGVATGQAGCMLLRAGGRGSICNNAASGNKAPLTLSQVKDHGKAQLSSLQCGLCDVRPAPCSAWLRAVAGLRLDQTVAGACAARSCKPRMRARVCDCAASAGCCSTSAATVAARSTQRAAYTRGSGALSVRPSLGGPQLVIRSVLALRASRSLPGRDPGGCTRFDA